MKKKILIVDDDHDIVEMITMILSKREYQAIAAYDGKNAIKIVQKQKPDIVLLDIMMPEINGIKVLEEIKNINPQTGVIMMTAFGDIGSYLDSIELGAFEYINKPFEASELLAIIKKVIEENNKGV